MIGSRLIGIALPEINDIDALAPFAFDLFDQGCEQLVGKPLYAFCWQQPRQPPFRKLRPYGLIRSPRCVVRMRCDHDPARTNNLHGKYIK
jgi:hypothetical protein